MIKFVLNQISNPIAMAGKLKLFWVFTLVFIAFFNGRAQEFKGFVSGGVTSSQIAGDDLSGFTKWGFYLGPKVTYPLTKKTDLGVQLLYTQKGSRRDQKEGVRGDGPWSKARLDYVDIPLFFQFAVNEDLTLHVGSTAGILINASSPNPRIKAENFKRVDLGGVAGGGYQLGGRFTLTVRFSHSILPFNKNSNDPIYEWRANGVFNSNLLFGLDYSLGEE